jgi:hypothetical protein
MNRLYGAATVTSYDIVSDSEVQRLEAGSEITYEDATFSYELVLTCFLPDEKIAAVANRCLFS